MRKVEYRCNHCMIIESKCLLNGDRSFDYITCRKCGLESKMIATEDDSRPNHVTLNEFSEFKEISRNFLKADPLHG